MITRRLRRLAQATGGVEVRVFPSGRWQVRAGDLVGLGDTPRAAIRRVIRLLSARAWAEERARAIDHEREVRDL